MSAMLDAGRHLYAALASGNTGSLNELLSVDFQGQLSRGLPHGLGRLYNGRASMMEEGWSGVGKWFTMSPEVDQLFDGGSTLIGQGHYVGTVKQSGVAISAAFAHFWAFDGTQFTGVFQVTDSGVWRDALSAGPGSHDSVV